MHHAGWIRCLQLPLLRNETSQTLVLTRSLLSEDRCWENPSCAVQDAAMWSNSVWHRFCKIKERQTLIPDSWLCVYKWGFFPQRYSSSSRLFPPLFLTVYQRNNPARQVICCGTWHKLVVKASYFHILNIPKFTMNQSEACLWSLFGLAIPLFLIN